MVKLLRAAGVLVVLALALAATAAAGRGGLTFTNTPLLQPNGDSEPAISIGSDSTMAVSGLSWELFQTNIWKGVFGSVPAFQGAIDAGIGKGIGGGDADIDIGSTGALHATTLMFFFNPATQLTQLGVSAITCPNADTSNNFAACTSQIIDTTQADRQWVTSDGPHVWISYHDSGSSTLIHVQRSDDDGLTWHRVGSPIPGQGAATGDATFNNDQGPIVADPTSHILFDVYAAGEASIQKGSNANFNNIYVSRSYDGGVTWTSQLVYHAPLNTALNNIFPSLAVDPANGNLYATWSDRAHVFVSKSTDHGVTWSAAAIVNAAPVNTALMPWVAARGGTVDVVYYGTSATSKDDPSAVWNTYLTRSTNGGSSFTQVQVSDHPNHVGPVCTNGSACRANRELLDLFENALDPRSGKAAVIYTDTTLTTTSSGGKLPQIVLAQQN